MHDTWWGLKDRLVENVGLSALYYISSYSAVNRTIQALILKFIDKKFTCYKLTKILSKVKVKMQEYCLEYKNKLLGINRLV